MNFKKAIIQHFKVLFENIAEDQVLMTTSDIKNILSREWSKTILHAQVVPILKEMSIEKIDGIRRFKYPVPHHELIPGTNRRSGAVRIYYKPNIGRAWRFKREQFINTKTT